MNTFIALAIPASAATVLKTVLETYEEKIDTYRPQDKWHMTLIFLGDTELSPEILTKLQEPLRTAYLPAMTILSLGTCLPAGRQANQEQLWAYIHATPALVQLRSIFTERLTQCGIAILEQEIVQEFVPHINLGTIKNNAGSIGTADTPAKMTFSVREALVLRSTPEKPDAPYELIATIPLVP